LKNKKFHTNYPSQLYTNKLTIKIKNTHLLGKCSGMYLNIFKNTLFVTKLEKPYHEVRDEVAGEHIQSLNKNLRKSGGIL